VSKPLKNWGAINRSRRRARAQDPDTADALKPTQTAPVVRSPNATFINCHFGGPEGGRATAIGIGEGTTVAARGTTIGPGFATGLENEGGHFDGPDTTFK
jgi:hypothetical protein